MSRARLDLSREQILAFRRAVGALDARLPPGPSSLLRAAWAGLQDSMPRAALLSIHARVEGTRPDAWTDPSLVQLWGPRFQAYVVAADDVAVFGLGRYPDDARGRRVAEDMAARLGAFLDGRTMRYDEAGHGIGVHPNRLRYGAATGTILIRWEGARLPTVRTVARPGIDHHDARLELARRHLRVFGPTTPLALGRWAGIGVRESRAAYEGLASELVRVRSPIGEAWILGGDEPSIRAAPAPAAPARLLPSGDSFFLLWGPDRELVVADARHRGLLWTSRVWPGALLVGGEVAGTWRRANAELTVEPWRRLTPAERLAVEEEARALPLPGPEGRIRVTWSE